MNPTALRELLLAIGLAVQIRVMSDARGICRTNPK
jgi:hypothetical protein